LIEQRFKRAGQDAHRSSSLRGQARAAAPWLRPAKARTRRSPPLHLELDGYRTMVGHAKW